MAKVRVPFMAPELLTSQGKNKEIRIGLWDVALAASAAGLSASVAVYKMTSGSVTGLNIICTSPASHMGFMLPMPQDIALTQAAAASMVLWVDWTSGETDAAVAVVNASIAAISTACLLTGGSVLGAACAAMTLGKECQLTSTSIASFNVPSTRDAQLRLVFERCAGDEADTSQANFILFGMRLRYKADRLGS